MNIELKKPTVLNIDEMQQLVSKEVMAGIILYRSDSEIATTIRSYTIAIADERIIGFAALHIHTKTLAEVRSLVVHEDFRRLGVGKMIVEALLKEAIVLGLKEVLTLTYKKEFFEKLGFVEIPKESIPDQKIWQDCIKCKHFPICNEVSLIKQI
ncbi:MAG: N-acetyltransferase [Campylobacterales bacterium]|nr:N-acetyltransferase [Campylobacterales bacterium]